MATFDNTLIAAIAIPGFVQGLFQEHFGGILPGKFWGVVQEGLQDNFYGNFQEFFAVLLPIVALSVCVSVVYLLGCIALYIRQQQLIFRPTPTIEHTPAEVGLGYETVWIPVNAHDRLYGWWLEAIPQPTDRILVYLHGNRGNVGSGLNLSRSQAMLKRCGVSVLLVDYRGFGQSFTAPATEAKVYEDVEAVWRYLTLTLEIPPQQIAVYGHSLGGAIAIDLASKHPDLAGLIVDASFTSMIAAAQDKALYRLFPLNRLVIHRFESIVKAPKLTLPTLFLHGTKDTVVPPFMSEELYAATPEPKQLHILQDVAHEDTLQVAKDEFLTIVSAFLDRVYPRLSHDSH